MSPLSRNPRDATIQSRDRRRWGRWRGSLRGRPLVVTSTGLRSTGGSLSQGIRSVRSWSTLLHRGPCGLLCGCRLHSSRCLGRPLSGRPGDCGLRGHWLLHSRCLGRSLASRPRGRRLCGCGRLRGRGPDQDQPLASSPGSRGLRGYDLVRGRRPEHGIEHAEQLPGHRHDGPLLTAAMHQPREQGSPFRALADQPPGCLHQGPPQQSRALLGDLQVLGLLLPALPDPTGTSPA